MLFSLGCMIFSFHASVPELIIIPIFFDVNVFLLCSVCCKVPSKIMIVSRKRSCCKRLIVQTDCHWYICTKHTHTHTHPHTRHVQYHDWAFYHHAKQVFCFSNMWAAHALFGHHSIYSNFSINICFCTLLLSLVSLAGTGMSNKWIKNINT